jgi:hypothetical protein
VSKDITGLGVDVVSNQAGEKLKGQIAGKLAAIQALAGRISRPAVGGFSAKQPGRQAPGVQTSAPAVPG